MAITVTSVTIKCIDPRPKNFDEDVLRAKAAAFMNAAGQFKDYDIIYRGLSMEDM